MSLNLTTDRVGTPGLRRMEWGGGGVEEHPVVGEVLVGVASDVIDGSSLMVTVVRVCEKDTEHGFGFPLAPVPPLRTPPPPELALPLTEVTMTVAVEADFWTALVWF